MPARVQTAISSVQTILQRQWQLLTSDPYLELGNNSATVGQLLSELQNALVEFSNVASHYTIEQGVTQANGYFQVQASLEQAIEFVKNVQEGKYGSIANTRQAARLIEVCYHNLTMLPPEKAASPNQRTLPVQRSFVKQKKGQKKPSFIPLSPPKLLEILDESFNKDELLTLCFELDVKYDNLAGDNLVGKARELVQYLQRHGELAKLEDALRRIRSHLFTDEHD